MGKVTLKDIANAAGVSVTTVSKIVNQKNFSIASEDTIEKINKVMEELGYVKSTNAVKQKKVTPSAKYGIILCSPVANKLKHPLFLDIYRGIENEVHKENGLIDFYFSIPEIQSSNLIIEKILSSKATNLILIDEMKLKIDTQIKLNFQNIINVNISNHEEEKSIGDTVCVDSYTAVRIVIRELVEKKRDKILFVSGDGALKLLIDNDLDIVNSDYFYDARTQAFRDELIKKKVLISKTDIIYAQNWEPINAYDAIDSYIKNKMPFNAIFAADDDLALACLNALNKNNIKVPEQVAIIGFNDLNCSAFSTPRISTIHIPCEELGRMAVQILILRGKNKLNLPVILSLPTEIVKRDTWL